jgi:hypothetical protein
MNENAMAARVLSQFRVGDIVEVRSAAEILATLDENGELENLPFMPEMLQYCGRRLTVHKVAHKLCDTISATGLRWINSAVHLTGARCDGQAHGGCQTGCQFYWKDAWLKPVTARQSDAAHEASARQLSLAALQANTLKAPGPDGEVRYACQATELLRAAPTRVPLWDIQQYFADLRTGNAGVRAVLRALLYGIFNAYQARSRRLLPSWLRIREGMYWGFVKGRAGGSTPTAKLDLRPGDVVRIRTKEEIARTLDAKRMNRGMGFEEEAARSCGKTARVVRRVERCIDEKTGRMLTMKESCIVLDGIVCEGVYKGNCPREFIIFWREIWLEPVKRHHSDVVSKEAANCEVASGDR